MAKKRSYKKKTIKAEVKPIAKKADQTITPTEQPAVIVTEVQVNTIPVTEQICKKNWWNRIKDYFKK